MRDEVYWRNWLVMGVCLLVGWRQLQFPFVAEHCLQAQEGPSSDEKAILPERSNSGASAVTFRHNMKKQAATTTTTTTTTAAVPSLSFSSLPARCGIVYFYHIGCTGGRATNSWLMSHRDTNEFFSSWGNAANRDKFVALMDEKTSNINGTEWKIAHVHHYNHGNNASWEMGHLHRWKKALQQQNKNDGCHFLGVVTLRDPLEHALAKFRYKPENLTNEEFIPEVQRQFQLNYFLYNFWDPPNHDISKQDKVTRALEIIDEFFPIVTLGSNLTSMMEQISRWVGWDMKEEEMPRRGESKAELLYSKDDIKTLQRLLQENGDADLYYALQQRFNRKLDYLSLS